MNKKRGPIKVGITMGDPSGIGPSIIALALSQVHSSVELVIIGDQGVFHKAQVLCRKSNFRQCTPRNFTFIDLANVPRKNFSFGRVSAGYGRASVEYLDKAMELIKDQTIDCLVTCPISKEAINLAGFHYSGHTEYFAHHTHAGNAVMMLLNKYLRFSLLTRHVPLKSVSECLVKHSVCDTIRVTADSLKKLFGIRQPRIIICGLNPHASDNGLLGREENDVISPAVKILHNELPGLKGPVSADTAIAQAYAKKYDCVIACYHDQALIPLKLLDASSGVNITLGLGFIRTSPLHGTAFGIAATGNADPRSLIAALQLAIQCRLSQKKV
ncbi:MAG: 4-hydroxythreonine-4-phosphate dehydrogenase PdxA [Candidatus Omnitrophota bacterium]